MRQLAPIKFGGHVNSTLLLAAFLVALPGSVGLAAEPAWLPALAHASDPQCPKNSGARERRCEIVQFGTGKAFIVEVARHDEKACEIAASLHLDRAGHESAYPLPSAVSQDFSIVDFSPNSSRLLLSAELSRKYPDEQFRYV